MAEKFKPIGGMFQEVRGSSKKGGSARYANYLLVLNEQGIIDDTTLPPDVVASIVTAKAALERVVDVSNSLNSERNARMAEDDVLDGKIGNETIARKAADSILGTRISNEETARVDADVVLQRNIEQEATARETTIANLMTDVIGPLGTRVGNLESAIGDINSVLDNINGEVL